MLLIKSYANTSRCMHLSTLNIKDAVLAVVLISHNWVCTYRTTTTKNLLWSLIFNIVCLQIDHVLHVLTKPSIKWHIILVVYMYVGAHACTHASLDQYPLKMCMFPDVVCLQSIR